MELEEMQAAWSKMSDQLENQKKLTNNLIMQMTQQRYKNRFTKISTYESIGAIVCFFTAIIIILNLDKMNTWYLMLSAVLSLAVLTLLPIITLRALWAMRNINITNNSPRTMLQEFTKKKRNLLLIQQLGVGLSVVLMWLVMPVFVMIADGNDFFKMEQSIGIWIFYAAVTLGVLVFARWGFRCYQRITRSAENDLKELDI